MIRNRNWPHICWSSLKKSILAYALCRLAIEAMRPPFINAIFPSLTSLGLQHEVIIMDN